MKNKECRSMDKFIVFLSLVMFLFIFSSCKKSPSQPSNETPDTQVGGEDTAQIMTEPVIEISVAEVEEPPQPSNETPDTQVGEEDTAQVTTEPATETNVAEVEEPEEVAADDSDLVPIEIELPEALFLGTPQDAEVENLEKPLGKARPPFMAPAGTTNVALGKPVKSNAFIIIGEFDYITDGIKESTDGDYLELAGGVQYVTIDLGEMYDIYAIVMWHLHRQPLVFFDVVVQTASDSFFIENVNTLFNNDIDNSTGLGIGKDMHYVETNEGKLIDAKGAKARYVRLYSNGYNLGDLNYYIEVEVYGKPAE